MGHVTLTTPLLGSTYLQLGLATFALQTEFEVSNYTHYEYIKSGAKCTNWCSLGRLGITQGNRQCHHSIERIRLPIRL